MPTDQNAKNVPPQLNDIAVSRIKSISTKIFYKNQSVHYQLELKYGEKPTFLIKEFDQLDQYQAQHQALLKAMSKEKYIVNDFLLA